MNDSVVIECNALFIKGGFPQNIELRKNIAQEQTDKKDIEQCRVFYMCPRNKKIVQEP